MINEEIKILLVKSGLSLRKLVEVMNKKFTRTYSPQGLSRKLTKNTIKFREVEEIADTLGCDIVFLPRDKNK